VQQDRTAATSAVKRSAVKKAAAPAAAGRAAPAPEKAPATGKAPLTRKAPAGTKKAPAVTKKAAAGTRRGSVLAATPAPGRKAPGRKAPTTRLAAEQTFSDDAWEEPAPAPAPAPEDPNARIRGILRAAARSLEARDRPPGPPSTAAPRPPRPAAEPAGEPAPVSRVLIAPEPTVADMRVDDMVMDRPVDEAAAVDDEVEEVAAAEPAADDPAADEAPDVEDGPTVVDEDGDWAPPDVIEEEEAPRRPLAGAPAPARTLRPRQSVEAPRSEPAAVLAPSRPTTPAAEPEPEPPPFDPKPKPKATPERRAGAGVPVLAIVLAVVVPLLGAVVGFVLATRARRRNAPLAGLARIVAVVAFVAWLVGGGGVAYARADRGIDYSKLKVGDCFDSSSTNQVRAVKVKSCSKPHNSEIFFLVTHPAAKSDAYPGKDQLVQFAADACLGKPLTDYLGIPLEQSKLKDFEIVPQESAWKEGRRVLVCGIDTGGQGRITGSVKGTRR
jgi:hypothetical protein